MQRMALPIFEALADPTRRDLLERLRASGPLSLSALAEDRPMSRQAVAKHLDALRDAGLVTIWRRGRERLHALDPEPLREVEDWLAPYAAAWDERLARLKSHLEETDR
jgi:DNA-binding transcriptional ArsR family regulator